MVYRWIKALTRNGRRDSEERRHLREQTRRFLAQVGYADISPEDLLTLYLLEALRRSTETPATTQGNRHESYELRSDVASALAGRSLFDSEEEWS